MTLENSRPSLRHPRTGQPLTPIGYTASGRAVWPILGGDENEDRRTRVNEIAARLAADASTVTREELAELRQFITDEAAADDGSDTSAATLEQLRLLSALNTQVSAEEAARAEADAQAATEAAALRAELAPAPVEPAAPEGAPAEPAAVVEGAPAEGAAPEGTPAEPELVTAGGGRPAPVEFSAIRRRGRTQAPAAPVERESDPTRLTLTAGGRPVAEGDAGIQQLTDLFNGALDQLRSPSLSRVIVASGAAELPYEIQRGDSAEVARRKMDDAVRDALAAGGGICRPVTIDYDLPRWVNLEEPVKGALPTLAAPRGGVMYSMPVAFDQSVYGAGVSIWTEPNDVAPGTTGTGPLGDGGAGTGPVTKPCLEIDCDTFVEVDVEAITQCIQLSNFRARFSPENVEAAMGYLQMAFVAVSEIERLKQMRRAAHHVTATKEFGATRDLLNFFDRVRAYYRSVYRLSDNVTLRVALESYVREIIRIDLRKAAFPYEGDSAGNSLMVSDAMIDSWFASVGIVPLWVLDDDTGDQTFAKSSPGTQGTPVAFPAFPNAGVGGTTIRVRALAYPEGSYQRLDGGTLDLGVTRDTASNAVNKFQIFSESFESVAFRGFEATDFRIDVLANGAAAGTIAPVTS